MQLFVIIIFIISLMKMVIPQSQFGIWVQGPNNFTLVENNYIHNLYIGIEVRSFPTGDFPGVPYRPVVRYNHVSHSNMENPLQQNNAKCIQLSGGTMYGLVENNLVHHCDDGGGLSDGSGSHIIRYNIAYLMNHLNGIGGNGPGIKMKPVNNPGYDKHQYGNNTLYYNIAFLNYAS